METIEASPVQELYARAAEEYECALEAEYRLLSGDEVILYERLELARRDIFLKLDSYNRAAAQRHSRRGYASRREIPVR